MKTNVCKIALMLLMGASFTLLFNSCSKDPVIPENETKNKLHEDPSKMTIRLVECHLHADWNEIQKRNSFQGGRLSQDGLQNTYAVG